MRKRSRHRPTIWWLTRIRSATALIRRSGWSLDASFLQVHQGQHAALGIRRPRMGVPPDRMSLS